MYQMVKDLKTAGAKAEEAEVVAPTAEAYAAKKVEDKRAQNAKKGWQTVEDDGFGGSFAPFSGSSATMRINDANKQFDQKATVKRNETSFIIQLPIKNHTLHWKLDIADSVKSLKGSKLDCPPPLNQRVHLNVFFAQIPE